MLHFRDIPERVAEEIFANKKTIVKHKNFNFSSTNSKSYFKIAFVLKKILLTEY